MSCSEIGWPVDLTKELALIRFCCKGKTIGKGEDEEEEDVDDSALAISPTVYMNTPQEACSQNNCTGSLCGKSLL
jgi:hypothetical protein